MNFKRVNLPESATEHTKPPITFQARRLSTYPWALRSPSCPLHTPRPNHVTFTLPTPAKLPRHTRGQPQPQWRAPPSLYESHLRPCAAATMRRQINFTAIIIPMRPRRVTGNFHRRIATGPLLSTRCWPARLHRHCTRPRTRDNSNPDRRRIKIEETKGKHRIG